MTERPIDLLVDLDTRYGDYRKAFEAMRESLTRAEQTLTWASGLTAVAGTPNERTLRGIAANTRAALALADRVSK
jgi:hypothetical protein